MRRAKSYQSRPFHRRSYCWFRHALVRKGKRRRAAELACSGPRRVYGIGDVDISRNKWFKKQKRLKLALLVFSKIGLALGAYIEGETRRQGINFEFRCFLPIL